MEYYKAPVKDMMYMLKAFQYTERVHSLEAFEGFDLSMVESLLQSAADIAVNETLPLNRLGDEHGIKWDPETYEVTTPPGFKEAYQKLIDNGLVGMTCDPNYGGSGGPEVLGVLFSELSTATNKSFSMCPGLTRGLIDALAAHGTEEQKQKYMTKLISGEWTGTMCLTEPQCGTDLGLINTKAVPQEDGTYKLTGTKIWITFGDHDMAENIIHLVLARLPDAPEGIKGISAFIVPKFIDGERNAVNCTGLEHKMGIKASPTCVIDFEDATGYLVGTPHKGMRSMFVMMNAARLHVGVEGIGLAEIAYQTALAFAKDRRQSRSLDPEKSDANAPADNILVHPDVRRMLLNIKSTNEALRALAVWISVEYDIAHHHPDEEARQKADDIVAILTPIIKSYGSERSFLNISEAMQVCGGAGYTTDWNIEQYLRDERIAMIYEGTNHIQALDLVGRKLPKDGGRMVRVFSEVITDMIRAGKENEELAEFTDYLKELSKKLTSVTMELAGQAMADREVAGAVASHYLNLFALTALTYVWCVQVKYAIESDAPNKDTKLKTARYFMHKVFPEHETLVRQINTWKSNLMEFDVEEL